MEEGSSKKNKQTPAPTLTEDLLREILARVPYKSLCRFKCVSRPWLALCSDPDLRKRSPQTLSGFFYRSSTRPTYNRSRYRHHFTNLSGRGRPMVDPSLSFLPDYAEYEFLGCCNGLLLLECRRISSEYELDYLVCNPATEKWVVLPDSEIVGVTENVVGICSRMYLCFDPAVSPHFKVFLLVQASHHERDYLRITGLKIYSSDTGGWSFKKSRWRDNDRVHLRPDGAFFNGTLHFITLDRSILAVDMEGKAWRRIPTPCNFSFIGLSHGRVYGMCNYRDNASPVSIWVLEDYSGGQWVLKDTVTGPQLFGLHHLEYGILKLCPVVGIHPESSLVFINVSLERNLVSYDMDNKQVHDICTLGREYVHPSLPYIPCFSGWL
uniref:F-box domain-containing protein n=1 Tax=Arundo donax TaxID=35708 RepID=A0A0A9CZS9_ARUDO